MSGLIWVQHSESRVKRQMGSEQFEMFAKKKGWVKIPSPGAKKGEVEAEDGVNVSTKDTAGEGPQTSKAIGTKAAIAFIKELADADAVTAYIDGDVRTSVIDAGKKQIAKISTNE